MPLNVSKGNMYPFITHTWNTVKGQCPDHQCLYCYMRIFKFKLNKRRFDEEELKIDLGEGNFVFVGSSNDMFSETVPKEWIQRTLWHCQNYSGNRYLFQSKNPQRFREFMIFPANSVLATTIESNRTYDKISNAPTTLERKLAIEKITLPTVVTMEPVLDFDLDILVRWMSDIKPAWINIGADSKGHNLPEPLQEKLSELIEILGKSHTVKLKPNLRRLMKL